MSQQQYRGSEFVGRRGAYGDDGVMDDWLQVGIVYDKYFRRVAGGKRRAFSKIKAAVKYMRWMYRREFCLDVKLISVMYMDPYPFSSRYNDEAVFLNRFIGYMAGRREGKLGYPDAVGNARMAGIDLLP